MNDSPMIFLICSERSVSNLIRAMMDAHPQVSAPQPLHLIRDVIARADALSHGDRDLPVAQAMLRLIRDRLAKQFPAAVAKAVADRVDRTVPFVPRAILQTLYTAIREETGAKLVMIKENELQDVAGQLIDAFPDARFVFQTRDPRDYLASAVALKTGPFGNKFGSFRNAMQVWNADQRFGLRMLGHFGPQRVFFQRYEDLVADPETVLRDLTGFLGLPFDPAMLSFHESETVKEFSTRKDAWKNLARPVMSDNFKKYRTGLSRRQIRAVEAAVGPLMDRLGYVRDYPRSGSRSWALVWPSLVEPLERWANGAWTPFYTVANSSHHAMLDQQAAPLRLPYADCAATDLQPGQRMTGLASRLVSAATAHARCEALRIDGTSWTYADLFAAAAALAARLPQDRPVIAVYGARHVSAYIGILATVLAGGTYVPLNPRFSETRNRDILQHSGASLLLCGAEFAGIAEQIARDTSARPESVHDTGVSGSPDWVPSPARPTDFAYILFTSGSTGVPKGVAITQANLAAYLDAALSILSPGPGDRCSQTFDLTFDLSVHDLFVAWSSGATLCVASTGDLADPAGYIRREAITHWFSVPTLGGVAQRSGALGPGAFTDLRSVLFCGEALPGDLARAWQKAAPRARLENWYGPTEATIACLRHVPDDKAPDGIVPIGLPFPGISARLVDDHGNEVAEGETGRLHVAGAQVAPGYLDDPDRTAAAFVRLPGDARRYYDTGDLAMRRDGVLHFRGRADLQAKIRGYRVELGEIETALRRQFPGTGLVALSWPPAEPSATHVVAVIETDDPAPVLDRAALAVDLPDYMIPSSLFGLADFPRNASGKIDRTAIAQTIQSRLADSVHSDPTSFDARVLAAIRSVKPTLSERDIRAAENLLMAGMDSLDFVNLTAVFAQDFGVDLDETRVALLANLDFAALVDNLARGVDAAAALAAIPADRMVRANRAIAFLDAAPTVLKAGSPPLVLAYGSSGTMRAIDTAGGESALRARGHDLRLLNVGLPALTASGLARMARHLAGLLAPGRVVAVLHEFDPVLLSVKPPKGDLDLDEAFFAPGSLLRRARPAGHELDWSPDLRGTLSTTQRAPAKARKPLWERARDHEIAAVYRGEIAFDPDAVQAWRDATASFAALGIPVLGWVHPLETGSASAGSLDKVLASCESAGCPHILRPERFAFQAGLFLNINHMAPGAGMQALTESLMHELHTVLTGPAAR